ncbi:hypothetical protein RFI_04879 [Reticulomyxa filosa]|uniref:Uncharacterized protein n=1 Tax=Reticulomyxa filosa TaxID=46433 RepID=X6P274_RETFI|nr:hypothetical protein RFI_04879 [Reticulomyxa filosa]|eukprot:ETO32238.1 hypothetical protein RFI_04879 [Reticulomyxa filosa]
MLSGAWHDGYYNKDYLRERHGLRQWPWWKLSDLEQMPEWNASDTHKIKLKLWKENIVPFMLNDTYYHIARENLLSFGWVGIVEQYRQSLEHLKCVWGLGRARMYVSNAQSSKKVYFLSRVRRARNRMTVKLRHKKISHSSNIYKPIVQYSSNYSKETERFIRKYQKFDFELYDLAQVLFLQQELICQIASAFYDDDES